jgi:hypothetical protein
MPAKLTQQSVAQPSFLVQSPINRLPSQGIKTHIIENPKKNQTTQFMILSQNKNLVPINTVVQQKEMSNIPFSFTLFSIISIFSVDSFSLMSKII